MMNRRINFAVKCAWVLVLVIFWGGYIAAQVSGFYRTAEAIVVESSADSSAVYRLPEASLQMQNSIGRLTMNLWIPDHIFEMQNSGDSILLADRYLFKLVVKLDPVKNMENALSTITLKTSGYVTINDITKRLQIEYSPILTGTDKTDYNMFLRVRFDAGDFNLPKKSRFTQYTIVLNNAPVNFQ